MDPHPVVAYAFPLKFPYPLGKSPIPYPLSPQFIVAPIQSLMQPSPNPALLGDLVLSLRPGQIAAIAALLHHGVSKMNRILRGGILYIAVLSRRWRFERYWPSI